MIAAELGRNIAIKILGRDDFDLPVLLIRGGRSRRLDQRGNRRHDQGANP
jgi:hypothetical protein